MKTKMLRAAFLVSTLAYTGGAAIAGPDETTNRLISEKVSMLDWGIFRLSLDLGKLSDAMLSQYTFKFLSPSFNWTDNTIELDAGIRFEIFGRDQAKGKCADLVESIRQNGGVFEGKLLPSISERGFSYYAAYFEHSGYTVTIDEKKILDFLPDLDTKFRIEVRIDFMDEEQRKTWVCRGRLISNSIAFEEMDRE